MFFQPLPQHLDPHSIREARFLLLLNSEGRKRCKSNLLPRIEVPIIVSEAEEKPVLINDPLPTCSKIVFLFTCHDETCGNPPAPLDGQRCHAFHLGRKGKRKPPHVINLKGGKDPQPSELGGHFPERRLCSEKEW